MSVFLAPRAGRAQEPPSLDEIIQGIERTEALFFNSDSLLIRYERSKTQKITATFYGELLLARWELAYKGDKWRNERTFTQPKETKKLLIPGKPKSAVLQGKVQLEWDQQFQMVTLDPFKGESNIYRGLFYIRNLSLDAPKHIAKSNAVDIAPLREIEALKDDLALPFLPDFLRKKQQYTVSSQRENVDGVPCWVVEWPGMDRFWVDPKRGFAIPRRKYCWGPGKPLMFEFRNREYREVKPGLWLPFLQIEDRYASIKAEKEVLWGKVASRSDYRVTLAKFDTLSDTDFDVTLPVGTRVFDFVRDFNYTVSGPTDAEPFSEAIAAAKLQERSPWTLWLAVAIIFPLILVVASFIYRLRSRWKPTIKVQ
jgi:hypothetical protein